MESFFHYYYYYLGGSERLESVLGRTRCGFEAPPVLCDSALGQQGLLCKEKTNLSLKDDNDRSEDAT